MKLSETAAAGLVGKLSTTIRSVNLVRLQRHFATGHFWIVCVSRAAVHGRQMQCPQGSSRTSPFNLLAQPGHSSCASWP